MIIGLVIIKELITWIVVPLMISHSALVYIEAEGECPDIDVDKIIDNAWSNKINNIMNNMNKTWSQKYLIKPFLQLYKWKGDIQFGLFKWIYHTRSGC